MAGRECETVRARRNACRADHWLGAVLTRISRATFGAIFNGLVALALVAGVLMAGSPAQAQTEMFDQDGRTIEYSTGHYGSVGMGHYLIQDGSGEYVMMFYKPVNVPAGRTYTSASVSYRYDVSRGAGNAVNITLMSTEATYDAAGFSLIRTSPSVGGFILQSGSGVATTSLSNTVVNEMNRLSADGGGWLYLGVSMASPSASVSASAYPFDVVAEFAVPQPTISSISPNSGPTSGGATVTITGTNLADASAVTFGGNAATHFTATATSISAEVPARAAGAVAVVVTAPGGTATGAYTYVGAPTISTISPNSGPATGLQTVVITGTNLVTTTAVAFNGAAAAIISRSDTELRVTTPAQASGAVTVTVTTPGGSATGGYTYVAAPTITTISPDVGPTSGVYTVTVTGTNLEGATSITFGGVTGAIMGRSATQLQVAGPALYTPRTVDVVVTTPGGTATAVNGFTAADKPVAGDVTHGPLIPYNTGTATPTIFSLAANVTNNPTRYAVGSTTTAQGGTVGIDDAGQVSYTPPVGYRDAPDTFTYTASNAIGASDPATVTVRIGNPAFTIALPAASGRVGEPYNSAGAPLTVTGGRAPYVDFSATGLPDGLSMNSAGVISGTPTGLANASILITLNDSSTGSGPATAFSLRYLTIDPPNLTLSPAAGALPGALQHAAYSQTFSAAGGTPDYSYTLRGGALPAGLTLSAGGVLSGTPTQRGTFTFTIRATDSSRGGVFHIDNAYSLEVVLPAPPTAGAVATTVAANSSGNRLTPVLGGPQADSIAVAQGPAHGVVTVSGLTFLYTPTAGYSGDDSFTYVATNAGGDSVSATVTVTVTPPVLALGDLSPATAEATTPYGAILTASLGTGPYSFAVSNGALPRDATLSPDGVLSGAPTVAGAFSFEVRATDVHGATGTRAYTLQVDAPNVRPAPAEGALPGGLLTVAYSQTFTATGGVGPYSWAVTGGQLPAGLTLATGGGLTGTPTLAGSHSFTVTATDVFGFTGTAVYALEIGVPVPTVQPQTATAVGGQSVTLDVTHGVVGVDITSVSVVSPPAHGTAVVQGMSIVYTARGDFSGTDRFTYTVNNAGGASAPGTVTITVHPAVATGPEKTVTILAGRTATVELTTGASGAPFTGAAVVSVGPGQAGTARIVSRTGQGGIQLYDLVFTPADGFTGEATVLYTLSNAFAVSAPGTVTITVERRPDAGVDPEVRGVATSQVTAAGRFAGAQISNFQRRMQALRDGTNGSSNGLSLNLVGSSRDRDPRMALRRELGQPVTSLDRDALNDDRDREMLVLNRWADRRSTGTTGPSRFGDRLNAAPTTTDQTRGHSIGFWTAGSVDWGREAADGQDDSRFTTQGVSAGLDVRVSDRLILGGGLGYGEDRTRIGDQGALSEGSAVTGALYASWRPAEAFYIDGVIGYADLAFSSRRWVQGLGGDPSGYAYGDRSGDILFASAAFGRVIRRAALTSEIYARVDAREMTLDAFTETGAGLSALAWDALKQSGLSANLGATLRWSLDTRRHGQIWPSARVEWSHELERMGDQGVRYADWAGSPRYLIPLDEWSRNAVNLDLGLEWSLNERLMLNFGYRAMYGDASSSHGGQFGLKYGW